MPRLLPQTITRALVAVAALVTTTGEARAQAADSIPVPAAELGVQARQLPCPDCNPPKRFWPAFGELMIVQLIPSAINNVLRDAEWAKISFSTWATNLENPWVWDNNKFLNNQFSHPYHGNLYFNVARTNGYNFWESVPWAFGGSLMWEELGEAWAPSPNDWLNTSLGGITLGETLYRLGTLTLDNTATGSERVWREIAATLLNPALGFNRLVRGQMNDVVANSPGWRPSKIWASIDVGYRGSSGESSLQPEGGTRDQGFVDLKLEYGDQVEDLGRSPFSALYFQAQLSSNQAPKRRLSDLTARGSLAARDLGRSERAYHQLALFMTYEYLSTPALDYGGQGFMAGLVSRLGEPQGFRVVTEALATAMPIAALQSDYYVTLEGRDYDYGLGFGGWAIARAYWGNTAMITARGRFLWTPVLSGFNGDHYQTIGHFEGRAYLAAKYGVGAALTLYHRSSDYDQQQDVTANGTVFRLYGSYAFPRWNP